jgi:hypothetical protein
MIKGSKFTLAAGAGKTKMTVTGGGVNASMASLLNPDKFQLDPIPGGLLHPEGSFRSMWDLSMILLLGYVATSVPMVIFLINEQGPVHIAIDLCADALFIIDIYLNFHTAYLDSNNQIVSSKRAIAWKYVSTWLLPDLISSIPVQIIIWLSSSASNLIVIKLFRMMKVLRLSRLSQNSVLSEWKQNGTVHPSMVKLVGYLLSYFLVLHFTACLFHYFVNSSETISCLEGEDLRMGVWYACDGYQAASLGENYTRAVYAAAVMLLGNDSSPRTQSHQLFAFLAMLLGVFFSSIVVGSFASLISSLDKAGAVKQDYFDRLNRSLHYHKISPRLASRVRGFKDYLYGSGVRTDEEMYTDLSGPLLDAVSLEKQLPLIRAVDIFRDVSPAWYE